MNFVWMKYFGWNALLILAIMNLVSCTNTESSQTDETDGDLELEKFEDDIWEQESEEAEEQLVLVDVIPYSRLDASDTRCEFFPWPIESKDGIATIRDDNNETSWKIPQNSETTLTVDLQPWLHKEAVIENASIIYEGEIQKLTIKLMEACYGRVKQSLVWENPEDKINISGDKAGCIQLVFETQEPVSLKDLEINAWILESSVSVEPSSSSNTSEIQFPLSGVIEGFYGVSWSWGERKQMIERMAVTGLGTYLYCPKWDDKHRENWREPYTADEMSRFEDLFEYSKSKEILFLFGISPFIDFDYSNDSDFDILMDKAVTFMNAGAGGIALLADDIEFETDHPVDADMGALQVNAVNRLFNEIKTSFPNSAVVFVPTVYSDERIEMFEDGFGYLNSLKDLESDIQIMWTGLGTSNLTMPGSDMDEFTAITMRKPVIWDNFWANDGGDGFTGRILLSAFSGRDETLIPAVSGIMHNASIQGGLSRLNIGSFATFMQSPETYEPSKGWEKAAYWEGQNGIRPDDNGEDNVDSLNFVLKLFDGNAQKDTGHREMESSIDSLIQNLKEDSSRYSDDVFTLLPIFGRMAGIMSEVHHSSLAVDIVDELAFPLQKVQAEGEMGLWSLLALAEKRSGMSASDSLEKAEAARERSIKNRFVFSGDSVSRLLDKIISLAVENRNVMPVYFSSPEQSCKTNEDWVWQPDENVLELSVFGLNGANVSDGAVVWPLDHGGYYRAIVTGIKRDNPVSWGFSILDFPCESEQNINGN